MKKSFVMNCPGASLAAGLSALIAISSATAQTPPAASTAAGTNTTGDAIIERIRDEGLNHSQVTETLSYLSDVIGARLTGSPNMKHANEWTRDKMISWGLVNAHLEGWQFGRGWELKHFSAQIVEPQDIPLKAFPNAWSPGFDKPVEGAEVVFLDATNNAGLEKFTGKLKGAIVLSSPIREVRTYFDPMARRLNDTNLLVLANADVPAPGAGQFGAANFGARGQRGRGGQRGAPPMNAGTNAVAQGGFPRGGRGGRGGPTWTRFLPFLQKEGVAAVLIPSTLGADGTIFVQSASVPQPEGPTNAPPAGGGGGGGQRAGAYSVNAPATLPQLTVAAEDYNRLLRMIQAGEKLKMDLDLRVKFYDNDPMAYNTTAEIPGTDLKDEIVMLGGHMDSWQSGTGATDNGAGVAVAMEAVRIIKALNLQPRRTIRVALWSGEEEGLLGSRAYVTKHFGYYTNLADGPNAGAARSPRDEANTPAPRGRGNRGAANRKLVKEGEYEKLSAYFNLDNGTSKIRGMYMQGNEAVRPIFRRWLDPFRDLGADTLTPSNTGSTDHVSFDNVGLPGFQFIQDPIDYSTLTHHSNEDVFDHVQGDDLKQAATIMAAFVYEAAMLDEKIPRKPSE